MPVCRLHGPYEDYCYDCRQAAEQAESDRADLLSGLEDVVQSHADMADAINNPGDYECPACGYKTLKYRRTACPKCRREVSADYWVKVDERAEEARRRYAEWAAEEAKRKAAQAVIDAEQAARRNFEQARADRHSRILRTFIFLGVAGVIAGFFVRTRLQTQADIAAINRIFDSGVVMHGAFDAKWPDILPPQVRTLDIQKVGYDPATRTLTLRCSLLHPQGPHRQLYTVNGRQWLQLHGVLTPGQPWVVRADSFGEYEAETLTLTADTEYHPGFMRVVVQSGIWRIPYLFPLTGS